MQRGYQPHDFRRPTMSDIRPSIDIAQSATVTRTTARIVRNIQPVLSWKYESTSSDEGS